MNPEPLQADGPSPPDARETVAAALLEHGRWLRTVLAARGVERHELDDVLGRVAAAAVAGADRLRDPAKVAPWLYRIAVVQALEHRRRSGRRRRLHEQYADSGLVGAAGAEPDPLDWLLAQEQQQLVRRALGTLGAQDAEILLLKYTEDWSYRELAAQLGLSASAVEARLHRARGRLRTALARVAPALVGRD
ncbi:MAG: sigma-70 family RNA polymerase sigma factor [Planctomycetales bacterium]|nr:sigma-70 family RNA polymerase sigma factor [Planctomycetales bacterium]